jgi:hypothetical protein
MSLTKSEPFDSWVRTEGTTISAQGRLRMSDDLDEAKIFYVDIEGKPSIRLELEFDDFHNFNVAFYCGLPVTIEADGKETAGSLTITKIKSLRSVFGETAQDAPG